jgi:hypothetical protein
VHQRNELFRPPRPVEARGRGAAAADCSRNHHAMGRCPSTGVRSGVRGSFLTLLRSLFCRLPLPLAVLTSGEAWWAFLTLVTLSLVLDHPATANNRFLVSDQHDLSTPDLLRRIAEALHRPSRVLPCPKAALHMAATVLGRGARIKRLSSSLVVDRQRGGQSLQWSAPTTLEYGLRRTAEWFLTMITR